MQPAPTLGWHTLQCPHSSHPKDSWWDPHPCPPGRWGWEGRRWLGERIQHILLIVQVQRCSPKKEGDAGKDAPRCGSMWVRGDTWLGAAAGTLNSPRRGHQPPERLPVLSCTLLPSVPFLTSFRPLRATSPSPASLSQSLSLCPSSSSSLTAPSPPPHRCQLVGHSTKALSTPPVCLGGFGRAMQPWPLSVNLLPDGHVHANTKSRQSQCPGGKQCRSRVHTSRRSRGPAFLG